jgi:hypothetical protein
MLLASLAVDVLAGVPNPGPVAPPGAAGLGNNLISWFKWIALVAGVLGLVACGIMMMVGRRNRSSMAADGAAGIPWAIGGLMVVSLAATIVGAIV